MIQNKFGFDGAALARLHACVMHEVEGLAAEEWETAVHLKDQQGFLLQMLQENNANIGRVNLTLIRECISGEVIRLQEELIDEVDANKRAWTYEYMGNLEALRARIEDMIKAGL